MRAGMGDAPISVLDLAGLTGNSQPPIMSKRSMIVALSLQKPAGQAQKWRGKCVYEGCSSVRNAWKADIGNGKKGLSYKRSFVLASGKGSRKHRGQRGSRNDAR